MIDTFISFYPNVFPKPKATYQGKQIRFVTKHMQNHILTQN